MRRLLVLAMAACFSFAHNTFAETIAPIDRGWYEADGVHHTDNLNYFVGDGQGPIHHNFFLFDLSASQRPIESALMQIFNPATGFGGADPFETYVLYDVTTSIQALIDGTGGTQAWDDLGSGIEFGTLTVTSADVATFISIELNADAITSMNASPGLFAIGGALTSHDGIEGNAEYVFGDTSPSSEVRMVTLVPEPTTALLLACGLAGLALRQRRRLFVLLCGPALLTLGLAPPASATAMFMGLGDLQGGAFASYAYGISGDGLTVVERSQ
jgi:hypothetical protein